MPNLSQHLNTWLATIYSQNTVQSYLISLVIFLAFLVCCSVVKRFVITHLGKMASKTANDFDDFIVKLISQVNWPVFIVVALYVSTSSLILADAVRSAVRYALIFVVTIRIILLLQEIIQYSVNKVLSARLGADNPSSKSMIKSVVWIIRWAVWALGAVFILDNLGVNISSLVAGIGIGGIAVAMASQAVLGDAFSALSIYLDKPFEVGDFIIIGDFMGNIEHIGLKTTRIRSLSGEQLVFSNSDLTSSRVRNYKRMQTRRIVFKVGVTYQTSFEKVQRIPVIIREILNKADVKADRVHFQSFGDSALIYETVYHVLSADYNVYMDKQQMINFAIMQEFAKEGIDFAYPTQTLYVKSEK